LNIRRKQLNELLKDDLLNIDESLEENIEEKVKSLSDTELTSLFSSQKQRKDLLISIDSNIIFKDSDLSFLLDVDLTNISDE
jgi:hypothetical protein